MELFTIGVYGKTPEAFFGALIAANIDTFCDVRSHRGMRGHIYSFVRGNRAGRGHDPETNLGSSFAREVVEATRR